MPILSLLSCWRQACDCNRRHGRKRIFEQQHINMDKRLALVILWILVIFVGSSIPGQDLNSVSAPDYLMHTAEYAVLGGLLGWWCFFRRDKASNASRPFPWSCLAVSILAGSIYGIIDEFHQSFVPGRCPDPRDWAADTAGTFAGALIILLIFHRLKRKDAEKYPAGA